MSRWFGLTLVVALTFSFLVACGSGNTDCTNVTCSKGTICRAGACVSCDSQDESVCDQQCVNLQNDPKHCGACGTVCKDGERCNAGVCTANCQKEQTACGSICTDTQSHPKHCGGCDNACKAGEVCESGTCTLTCKEGNTSCSGSCVDLKTNAQHCGTCGTACKSGQSCQNGSCKCPTNQTDCSGTCVNTQNDPKHCGACGNACKAGEACVAGECSASCRSGQTNCSGVCVDNQTDSKNCGACGNVCGSSETCCGGSCIDLQKENKHCGTCGTSCTEGKTCQSGACKCGTGLTDCSGSCVDTNSSTQHCGACGTACNSGETCQKGTCQPAWARSGGGLSADSSEGGVDLTSDNSGNVYLLGSFRKVLVLGGTTLTSQTGEGYFVAKYSNSFAMQWAKVINAESASGIAVDSSGNTYVVGGFSSQLTFGTSTLTSTGKRDLYVVKYNSSGDVVWAKSAGGVEEEYVRRVSVDTSGNPVVIGAFGNNSAVFGTTTLAKKGSFTIFVAKLSSSGSWLWAKEAGGTDQSWGQDVTTDKNDNVYITGYTSSNPTFGSLSITTNNTDAFVAKLDKNGAWKWVKAMGGSSTDIGYGVAVDGSGNVFTTGYFRNTAVFGTTTLKSNGSRTDPYFAMLDTNGNWKWARAATGGDWDYARDVAVDSAGNSYFTGYFKGNVVFGTTTLASRGNSDIYLVKFNKSGAWQWVRNAGGGSDDSNPSITINSSGNPYLTGYISSSASFGTFTLTAKGSSDVFLAQWDTNGNVARASSWGGLNSSSDISYDIAVDGEGNSHIVGNFTGDMVLGSTTLSSSGSEDIFVAKLDKFGAWKWAVRAGGTERDYGRSVAIDSSGNVFVTGYFSEIASFGSSTLTSKGGRDIVVAKLDKDGKWLWSKHAGSSSSDYSYSIATDPSGNAYVTGYIYNNVAFGSTTLSTGTYSTYVAKIDKDGKWLWATNTRSVGDNSPQAIAVDQGGNAYITGDFESLLLFGDIALTSKSEADGYIAKVSNDGKWLWAKQIASTDDVSPYGIALDASANVYVTGEFENESTFGSVTLTSKGEDDVFVAKLDKDGNWQWVKQAGGTKRERAYSITTDKKGTVYLTGYFSEEGSFGNTSFSLGSNNRAVFVAALDDKGAWQWAKASTPSTSTPYGHGIGVDSSGLVYVTGYFYGAPMFGKNTLNSQGSSDFFVWQIAP